MKQSVTTVIIYQYMYKKQQRLSRETCKLTGLIPKMLTVPAIHFYIGCI